MDAVNHIKLSLPRAQVVPALRALLYAIFFQRSMDTVEPETYEVGDAHVACAPSAAVEKEVAGKLEEFAVEYLESGLERGELAVVFLQKKPRKGWFAVTEELIPWELHLITVTVLPSTSPTQTDYTPNPYPSHAHPHPNLKPGPGASSSPRSLSLIPPLAQILSFCAEKRYNVPVLSSGEGGGLSHQIMINPPPPSELFAPSPPLPARARSPPLHPTPGVSGGSTTRGHAHARSTESGEDMARRGSAPPYTQGQGYGYGRSTSSGFGGGPGGGGGHGMTHAQGASGAAQGDGTALGYLEQAKDGLRAVRAGAGVVANWAGRGKGL